MPALVLSVSDPQPVISGEPSTPATLTVAAGAGGDASMTGAFKGRIQTLGRSRRQWPHHLTVAAVPPQFHSFTR